MAVLCQNILDRIERWAENWGLKISADKTESIVYNYGKLPTEEISKLKTGNKTTEYTKHAKLLGMTFDSELNWKSHFDSLIDRRKKDLNLMRYISGAKYGADRKTLLMLYTSLIRSKLDYGCQAYATTANTSQLQGLDRILQL